MESLLVFLLIGAIAGWLAGVLVKGYGFGLVGNIVVGVVGAVLGGWLLNSMGLFVGNGIVPSIVGATFGAVVLLLVLKVLRRAT
jgi:uncharacterized membrane protein YeaQ/YmgE (transglycosylase-associated protein family)